ncbi:MAG TPA: arabinan endo-1,5-alpha-L-arabinosidase [Phototrophicaceae bacterium]|nr:arabinan endo-1,5-alpha-L-arabinosidase [Phototrophicaceae bacterium]
MPVTRRQFLWSSLVIGASASIGISPWVAKMQPSQVAEATPEPTAEVEPPSNDPLPLTGVIGQVHDPCIIKAKDAYYVFCTGDGIPVRTSPDLLAWSSPFPVSVFPSMPDWAFQAIPGATNIWAPDISFYNGKYQLYYAVSTFGSNFSAIGLATNTTLNSKDPDFNWVDEGLVIQSFKKDDYNCIDPNFVLDADGNPWLAFGSFWSGLKLVRLDPTTRKPSQEDTTLYSIAQRPAPDALEASFIVRREKYYYLFASFDNCCQGAASTYNVRVGRSEKVTGEYVDQDGVSMLTGGGTQITFPTDRWKGPGHCGILIDNGIYYIAYHAYDAQLGGSPTLRINPIIWDADGWPTITEKD